MRVLFPLSRSLCKPLWPCPAHVILRSSPHCLVQVNTQVSVKLCSSGANIEVTAYRNRLRNSLIERNCVHDKADTLMLFSPLTIKSVQPDVIDHPLWSWKLWALVFPSMQCAHWVNDKWREGRCLTVLTCDAACKPVFVFSPCDSALLIGSRVPTAGERHQLTIRSKHFLCTVCERSTSSDTMHCFVFFSPKLMLLLCLNCNSTLNCCCSADGSLQCVALK